MVISIFNFRKWTARTGQIRQQTFGVIDRFNSIVFPLEIFFGRKIGITRRTFQVHQTGNTLQGCLQNFQICFAQVLILNFCQQSIQFQNTVPFKKLCRNLADLLNSILFLNIHKTQIAHDPGIFSKNIEPLPLRSSQKRTFECFNLCFTFFQHLAVTGQQGHCFDLFSRWLSAFFRHKLLNSFIYLMTAT